MEIVHLNEPDRDPRAHFPVRSSTCREYKSIVHAQRRHAESERTSVGCATCVSPAPKKVSERCDMNQLGESQARAKLIGREREAESLPRYIALLKQSEIADMPNQLLKYITTEALAPFAFNGAPLNTMFARM